MEDVNIRFVPEVKWSLKLTKLNLNENDLTKFITPHFK
jgi:hypothetical protein